MSVTPGCKQTASAFYSRNQSRLVDMSLTLLAGQCQCHQRPSSSERSGHMQPAGPWGP